MTERSKSPKAYAIQISKVWGERFPVDVFLVAKEIGSRQKDHIHKIESIDVPMTAFEGALLYSRKANRWGISYSSQIRESGKIRFTVAHELGHYLLHRHTQRGFTCSGEDMRDFGRRAATSKNIEQEANEFASYLLMPISDYRRQVEGQEINIALLGHCADRYGTSLTASAIKLIEFVDRPFVAVLSQGGVVKWSRSSDAAFKLGCFLTKGTTIPADSLTMRCHLMGLGASNSLSAFSESSAWFKSASVHESAVPQPHYGCVFTLLECIGIGTIGRTLDDQAYAIDSYDHFSSYSR